MRNSTLWIVQDDADNVPDGVDETDVFVIDDELRDVSEGRVLSLVETLIEANIVEPSGCPTYNVTKNYRVAVPTPKYSLALAVIVYKQLRNTLREQNIARVQSEHVLDFYVPVIQDVCEECAVTFDGQNATQQSPIRTYLSALSGARNTIADSLLSAVGDLFDSSNDTSETVFLPRVDRFETIRPVLDNLSDHVDIYDTEPRHPFSPGDPHPAPDEYDTTSILSLTTPKDALDICKFLFYGLPKDLFSGSSIKSQLKDVLEQAEGVTLDRTLDFAVHRLGLRSTYVKVYSVLIDRLLEETACEKLVVNAIGVGELAMLREAEDIGTYFVPHGTVNGYEGVLPPSTNRFTAGTPGKQHIQSLPYQPESQHMTVTGLPKLARYHQLYFDSPQETDGPMRILLTTQPVHDGVRATFALTVLQSLAKSDQTYDPVIKTHPNEDPEFYERLLEDSDMSANIVSGNLVDHLQRADVVVTIFSNTGLEAITVGTPCLSVNLWSPFILGKPYIRNGPVPLLESPSEAESFFCDVGSEDLNELLADQLDYLKDEYNIDGDPGKKMADFISGK